MRRPILVVTAALALLAGLAGCAQVHTVRGRLHFGMEDAPEGQRLLWPQGDVPRYLYAGTLTGEPNFQRDDAAAGTLVRIGRLIAGLDEQPPQPLVLQRPSGVIGDDNGRLFVSDVSKPGVFVFDEAAGELHVWERASPALNFVAPVGMALAPEGGLFVADAELGAVFHLDAKGEPRAVLGEGQLRRPTGLARDPARGLLFVADTYAHDVKVFDDRGGLVNVIGRRGTGDGEFNYPTHLAFARDELYVTDSMNSRVQVFGQEGRPSASRAGPEPGPPPAGVKELGSGPSFLVSRKFGERGLYLGNLVRPKGIGIDGEGNVYVIESYFDNLLVFSSQGEFLLPIGGTGTATGRFYLPSGVWVDARNRVHIADTFNGRVVLFQFLGGG